ncbi:Ig-like domain-containing protein [Oerskovia sp. M15]
MSTSRDGDTLTVTANGNLSSDVGALDGNFAQYVGQAMSTLTATLVAPLPALPAAPTSTTLAVAPAGTSVEGVAVALAATVTPVAAGSVEFLDGATSLGTVAVSDGVARLDLAASAVGSTPSRHASPRQMPPRSWDRRPRPSRTPSRPSLSCRRLRWRTRGSRSCRRVGWILRWRTRSP